VIQDSFIIVNSMCAFINALEKTANNALNTGLHRWDVLDVLHTR